MKKHSFFSIATAIGVLAIWYIGMPQTTEAFSGGDGSTSTPYLISNCADLQEIDDVTSTLSLSYELTTDLTCLSWD